MIGSRFPLHEFWERLRKVTRLSFQAESRSGSPTGWSGTGHGIVAVERQRDSVLLFHERGVWKSDGAMEMAFSNVFRWTREEDGTVRLDHLRFGAEKPVYLFDLRFVSRRLLQSAHGHTCREDCYAARVQVLPDVIEVEWTIRGPRMNEYISYKYD